MTRGELLALVARVEVATAETQGAILMQVLDYMEDVERMTNVAASRAREWVRLGAYESAAASLVREGACWSVTRKESGLFVACVWRGPAMCSNARPTAALALTAACLRAKAREPTDE